MEGQGRDGTERRTAYGDHVDERRLAAVLQAYEREFHLLLPEEALDPVEERVNQRREKAHFGDTQAH